MCHTPDGRFDNSGSQTAPACVHCRDLLPVFGTDQHRQAVRRTHNAKIPGLPANNRVGLGRTAGKVLRTQYNRAGAMDLVEPPWQRREI
jgi:hypothetical protein